MDEEKKKKYEEEKKEKESMKLREIETQKAAVQKLYQTLGLDTLLENIEEQFKNREFKSMIKYSTKCQFLFTLMQDLKKNGHRLLIFTMSKKMLNLIEEILKSEEYNNSFKYLRIDGDTEISSREGIC